MTCAAPPPTGPNPTVCGAAVERVLRSSLAAAVEPHSGEHMTKKLARMLWAAVALLAVVDVIHGLFTWLANDPKAFPDSILHLTALVLALGAGTMVVMVLAMSRSWTGASVVVFALLVFVPGVYALLRLAGPNGGWWQTVPVFWSVVNSWAAVAALGWPFGLVVCVAASAFAAHRSRRFVVPVVLVVLVVCAFIWGAPVREFVLD